MCDGCYCQKCQGQYATLQHQKKKWRGLSHFKSASLVSSSLQSDLASLCNNIQGEDNCWVHAHGLALIFKTGHGAAVKARVTHDRMQAYYFHQDLVNGVVLSDVNDGGQFCVDLSVLTEGPPSDCTLYVKEQLTDKRPHHRVNRFRVMKCQFRKMTNNQGESVA